MLSENTFAGHWETLVDCMENIGIWRQPLISMVLHASLMPFFLESYIMDGYFLGEENGIVNTGLVYDGTFFLGLPDAYVGILF